MMTSDDFRAYRRRLGPLGTIGKYVGQTWQQVAEIEHGRCPMPGHYVLLAPRPAGVASLLAKPQYDACHAVVITVRDLWRDLPQGALLYVQGSGDVLYMPKTDGSISNEGERDDE